MSTHVSSWLAGNDVTTPAHDRRPVIEQPSTAPTIVERVPAEVPRRGVRPRRTDGLAFLAAVWVVVAAVPVAYLPTRRLDMFWSDAMVGFAAGVVILTRLVRPGMAPSTTGITLALGGWLAVAPFALGYGTHPGEHLARLNDLAVGTAVAALSLATMVAAKARPAVPPGSAGLVVGTVEPTDG
jgi:hypothetical protein